ncbi:VOC family protein [candidate division TA06 bacterium]|nr:VOC family protein [candidate division TA06 bacterium]
MKANRIFETVLYAKDLAATERFYRDVLGLEVLQRGVLRCGEGVLLIFNPEYARKSGRGVPSHGTEGAGHIAFAMREEELEPWRNHLQKCGVEIEMEVEWKEGGRSIYFRDPAGNSVELAPSTLWGGGWVF